MKFIPILFSTPMVLAIMEGRKTQTRRIMKPQPPHWDWSIYPKDKYNLRLPDGKYCKSPYGKPGDILWVRETFINGYEMQDECFKYDDKGDYISKTWYKADRNLDLWFDGIGMKENVPWKPSIHMPKEACRLFVKITKVRVERLQDITPADALSEGIQGSEGKWKDYRLKGATCAYRTISFISLWESINGEESWKANPWVWVIEFERIEKPENWLA